MTLNGSYDGSADLLKFTDSTDTTNFYVGADKTQVKITPAKSTSKNETVTY